MAARTRGSGYHRKQSLYEQEQAHIFYQQIIAIYDKYFDTDGLKQEQLSELEDLIFKAAMGRFKNVRENYIEGLQPRDPNNYKPVEEVNTSEPYHCLVLLGKK